MTPTDRLLASLSTPAAAAVFTTLYGPGHVDAARRRYAALIDGFPGPADGGGEAGGLRLFTAAGRTELGGNHTDHNRGKVLAASVHLDAAAVAAPRPDPAVLFRSTGHDDVVVDLSSLDYREEERGTTAALVRGVAAAFARRGVRVHGFTANAASTVLTGSGLSSSAAVEVLFGKIFDCLYGKGDLDAVAIARMGQYAENNYFGKPCGLMDQVACASGGVVAIDFAGPAGPQVGRAEFDPEAAGYALCVVDTRGSHADLTEDYAAIPRDMRAVAAFFHKDVLRDVDEDDVLDHAGAIREAAGDRALLRALHFFDENRRVDAMCAALETLRRTGSPAAMTSFLRLVNESGDSSWELLQNVYAPQDPRAQGVAVAIAMTRRFLAGAGAVRVHGGGFAGTIQAYIPVDALEDYREYMERCFGDGAVTPLRIRSVGAAEIRFDERGR